MKRFFIFLAVFVLMADMAIAQRKTDRLDRGLVVIPTGSTSGSTTNMVTWRRFAEEYYGVTYNLYKDGSRIATGLTTPCYADNNRGYPTTQYQVAAVVNGTEQAKCTAVTAWTQYVYKLTERCPSGYIDIPLGSVYDRNGTDVTSHYLPNDAEFADLDADGQLEMIIKRLNTVDAGDNFPESNTTEFDVIEAYDINWQTGAATRLWWIDVGPNMVSGGSHELNIIAYDWDEDGQAEVVLRGADNMIVHWARGASRTDYPQRIGSNTSTRSSVSHTANMTYTNQGAEYLLYLNGNTGEPYVIMDYPLARGNASDWGDGYGHRSSKYFFGAPVLDGRKASLYLGRGIYTKELMAAYDINPDTHQLTQRWTWSCTSNNAWYGNGYHNYCIADVDEDGRDEIVYGSMVIDDNGQGLSTTGLGHGDALHCSDFDPFREGLEIFACNESQPSMNYRNATTSAFYVRRTGTDDDGRALCGNFSNTYPGACGRSVQTGMISCVADQDISELGDFIAWGDLNFRIYWDGDLLSEVLNGAGTEGNAKIEKPGTGRLFTTDGCNMNNWTKNHPCFQGDLIGDWREELVLRCGQNVRIYTSGMYTSNNIYTLWHDHNYRQAMVWQMHAYNQPPHPSFFLGELEDITVPPPPLTLTDRTVVEAGGTITTTTNNQDILTYGYANNTYNISSNVSSRTLIMNVPAWTQGHGNNSNITTTTYTHNLNIASGGGLSGTSRLVKQGKGILNISNATLNYTGGTDIWGGTVNFNGTLSNSKVWMNRFTTLNSNGGSFPGGIEMCYAAKLNVGGATAQTLATVNVGNLTLNYGSRVVLDINGTTASQNDQLNIGNLTIGTKVWSYGPQYSQPVFYINARNSLGDGMYPIGTIGNDPSNLSDILIESNGNVPSGSYLLVRSGILYLVVGDGVPKELTGVDFQVTAMHPYNTYYWLPEVRVVGLSEQGNQNVTISGTFTSDNGSDPVNSIGGDFYRQDYEQESSITGWTSNGAAISLATGDATYGNYFLINTGNTNTRYAYTRLNNVDVTSCGRYRVEFDLAVKPANTDPVEFCVMSKNGINPTYNWDNYAAINGNANMLFDITAASNSTTYTVNGTAVTTVIPSDTWQHYTLNVDQDARTVAWSISNGASGTFQLPDGTSTEFNGFYLVAGRYQSIFRLDNIVVTPETNNTWRFTKPGRLDLTVNAQGYAPYNVTYEIHYPYAIYYESPAYNEIAAADVAATLGEDLWNNTSGTTRWANWSRTNATYGDSYVYVAAKNNSGYIDRDSVLTITRKSSSYPLTFLEGFGVGQNGSNQTTVSATALGDENTIIYHKIDTSWGNAASYDEGYTYANADGSCSFTLTNNTFCKLIAYVPIHEECDELSTSLPSGSGDGNISLFRTFSSITSGSGWNTVVLPFDMNEDQIMRTFGPCTMVAQMTGSTFNSISFNTNSRQIYANVPCLIRVGKLKTVAGKQFYVFAGTDRDVEAHPKLETQYFDFVGSYVNSGKVTFPSNTYFYNSSNGNALNKVAENNSITFKGYRAYFSAKDGSNLAKSVSLNFDNSEPTGIMIVDEECRPQDIYSIGGQLIRKNAVSLDGLPDGIYIVNGKKLIVKH